MANELRVTFLAGTLGRAGAEQQLMYMLRALHSAGVALRVLSLTRGEAYEQDIRALGIECVFVGGHANQLARVAAIIAELRRHPADILQTMHTYTNLYAAVAARATGAFEIGAVRDDLTRSFHGAWWLLTRASLRVPRLIIANSEAGQRNAQRHAGSPSRVRLVRNVVDASRFFPPSSPPAGPVRVLLMGRLTSQKRPDRFLRAIAELKKRQAGRVEAWLAGTGELREEMETYAASLGLTERDVKFLGLQADAAALLREVHVLALTSDWEGQPNVLLEAMATGLPVVATDVGGVREIVPDGAGLIVDSANETALWEALETVVSSEKARSEMGACGLEFARRACSLETLDERLFEVYETALSGSR